MNAIVKAEAPEAITAYLKVIQDASANPNIDVAKLEKLLDMQERVIKHHAEVAFSRDFARMQGQMPIITEQGEIKVNGQVRSKYALFEDINEEIRPVLREHGFSVFFKITSEPKSVKVQGILMHEDGHREMTEMMLEADESGSKNTVQSIGSSVSYAKRYVLCALLNITSRGEDDDGNAGGSTIPSCWSGPNKRKHYLNEILRCWGKNDEFYLRQLWDELDNDQREDLWKEMRNLSTPRNEIKDMLAKTKEERQA